MKYSSVFGTFMVILFFIVDPGQEWTATTEKLKHGKWDQSVFLPNGIGLFGHSLAQINSHETVLIGGLDNNFKINNNVSNQKLELKN